MPPRAKRVRSDSPTDDTAASSSNSSATPAASTPTMDLTAYTPGSVPYLLAKVRASDLHPSKYEQRDLLLERPGTDDKGAMGMLMEKMGMNGVMEPAQFGIGMKLLSSFLTLTNESDYPTFTAIGTGSGHDRSEFAQAQVSMKKCIDNVDVKRDIRPKLVGDRWHFKHDGDKIAFGQLKDGEEMVFTNVHDARGLTDLNAAPLLTDMSALAGNPEVAVIFTCKVWKGGGVVSAFTGGPVGKTNKDGWSVSYSIVSIFLLGSGGGGMAEMAQTPKKARHF